MSTQQPADSDPRLNREIIHLLLQVAWADDEITETEVEHLIDRARRASLSDDEIADIRAYLAGDKALPMPDLGLLRAHKKKVLLAVGTMMGADGDIRGEEKELFDQIRDMLKDAPART